MAPGFWAKLWKGIKKGVNVAKNVVQKLAPVVKPLVEKIPGYGGAITKGIDVVQKGLNFGDELINGTSGGGVGGGGRRGYRKPTVGALDYYAPPPTQQQRKGTEFLGPILRRMDGDERQLAGGDSGLSRMGW